MGGPGVGACSGRVGLPRARGTPQEPFFPLVQRKTAAPQGASEDILSAKNALYQHLTWDTSKNVALCPKLAPPLATPVVLSPPPSPRPVHAVDGARAPASGRVRASRVCVGALACARVALWRTGALCYSVSRPMRGRLPMTITANFSS